ncbi:MAG: universal stress protein [Desulfovibrio sp.]|nr:universal stress protein [Desulfovibrio sp.]MCA1985634.1 universal stress protein [Desulfovibrio sp.]
MKLLVAHDGSPQAGKALDMAATLAKNLNAEITVVTVTPDLTYPLDELPPELAQRLNDTVASETRTLLQAVAKQMEEAGHAVKTTARTGRPADGILAVAKEIGADMILVGSTGKQGASRLFLGSVSGSVAQHAPVSVLVVR